MKRRRARRPSRRRPIVEPPLQTDVTGLVDEVADHPETSPRLSAGDLDADWRGACGAGEETVGGSVATPDQDVVDEIGAALGVPQDPDAEVTTSAEILADRDRHRWQIEGEVAAEEEGRTRR